MHRTFAERDQSSSALKHRNAPKYEKSPRNCFNVIKKYALTKRHKFDAPGFCFMLEVNRKFLGLVLPPVQQL
jgi:hypothetical protein